MTTLQQVDWSEARAALAEAATQVAALLRSVDQPEVPVLGEWNVVELATHLSHAFSIVPALARREVSPLFDDLWEQPARMVRSVADDPERDLAVLADLIEARSRDFLQATADASAADRFPWLVEGSTLSIAELTCHLLNEAVIHGYDISRAAGKPWAIDRRSAALIFLGFILPVFQALGPRTMVDQEKAAGVRAAYDVRLRGGGGFSLVFDDGAMTVEGPSSRKVDCHLSVDPAAFLLVGWGRISQWRAIPRGQLLAWGRRPWLGLRMRGLLRNP